MQCPAEGENVISSDSHLLRLAVPIIGWYPLTPHGFCTGTWLLTCKHERLYPWLFPTVPYNILSGCFAEQESWWREMGELPLSWDTELLWLQEQIDTWVWLCFHLCVMVFVICIAESAAVDKAGSRCPAVKSGGIFSKENTRSWCHPRKLKSCLSVC